MAPPTAPRTFELAGLRLELDVPIDPEALIDEEAFAADERLPYWAEPWPSGLALAARLAASPADGLCGVRVLELGCGLGLPSLAAAARGARVLATDWERDAVELLRRNSDRNGIALEATVLDWRSVDALPAGAFDLVLAADVLYEERNAEPVLRALARAATPGGTALLADPGRRHAAGFLELAAAEGWVAASEPDARLPNGAVHVLHRRDRVRRDGYPPAG